MTQSWASRLPLELTRGWTVLLGAFVLHTISHGIIYSFGQIFVELQQNFRASRADLSWIGSTCTGVLFLIAPIASALCERFRFRLVALSGACITSAGYIISSLVTSLPALYVTTGAMAGFGFGLMFQAAIVVVTESFREYRALACGVAISGCGIGAFIFNPFMKRLLEAYGWSGSLLVLAAVNLNCIPCALLLKSQRDTINKDSQDHGQKYDPIPIESHASQDDTRYKLKGAGAHDGQDDTKYNVVPISDNLKIQQSCIATCAMDNQESVPEEQTPLAAREMHQRNVSKAYTCTTNENPFTEDGYQFCLQETSNDNFPNSEYQNEAADQIDSNSDKNIVVEISLYDKHKSAGKENGPWRWCSSCTGRVILLKDRLFLSVVIASFFMHSAVYIPFMYIPDRSREQGLDDAQTVWVVSTIGLTSIIGRIGIGYLVDSFSVNRMTVFNVALFVAGASTACGPLYQSVWSLVLYAVMYGVSFGVVISFLSIIVTDILGLHRLNEAYGLVGFFNGVGTMVGPPCAGFLFDYTGSYDIPFVVLGSLPVIGCLLVVVCAGLRRKP